ncbi:hypothetical protein ABER61_28805 [Brevibacillus formosus]|uniref:DUF4747 domain-containing protein n=1 Tax=Brevibacillus formosus TaxID=54913 RepID=A0A837KKS4_9BACL|nr:hypothetical protein [Brevibacillus formosus]KLH98064.1 hypothetical protein AA984_13625 [Brevibacillus formosus]MED1960743.1 hypothetical protein [Brevibacillus formosus]PSJ87051.1 hypothetical protein C7R91_29070 [Brevibacillus formosus]GED61528.1 hypothetical protein BFO01nite_56600 [Brevibacillus formosus]
MSTKFVKIYGFEIITPKFFGNGYDMERYDHDQMEYFFSEIMNLKERKRVFHYKGKMINLVSCKQSSDADFMEGVFTSAKFGQEQDIINVYDQTTTGQKGKNEGVKNEVHFVLQKKTGLLLVQYDDQRVVSRDLIKRFFDNHLPLMDRYKSEFKKVNKPYEIPKSFLQIKTLPSKQFFDELRQMATIKEAYVLADLSKGTNNQAVEFLRNEAQENEVDGFQQIKISLLNKVKRTGIRHIEDYFKKMLELEAYDGYGVSGIAHSGKTKNLTMARVPHNYDINVSVNTVGLISVSELISQMVYIAKYDNPLAGKNDGVKPLNKVNVGEEIDEETEGSSNQKNERIS